MRPPRGPGGDPHDTIVACATPWGRAAIAVVRLSGEGVAGLLSRICPRPGGLPEPRRAVLVRLRDSEGPFDEGLLTFMPGPASYTGEDCAELSCHGNPLLVERLLAACVAAGARPALPGEFTRRAHANGRLDLLRAEAVLQAIEARSSGGLEVAAKALRGELGAWIGERQAELATLAAELEARLDFPDQLELLVDGAPRLQDDEALAERLELARQELLRAAGSYRRARVQVDGARVALIGPVNAGKSSLFNALLGRRRALVSAQPGTTRDVLEASLEIRGLPVVLLDTAGENPQPEELERSGMALRDELLAEVDLRVLVLPAHQLDPEEHGELIARSDPGPLVLVGNHADRPAARFELSGRALIPTCAPEGRGLDAVMDAIAEALVGEEPGASAAVVASQRQHELLRSAAEHLAHARWALRGEAGVAVAAEELIAALEGLDAMGGGGVREEVLDTLFARFCIGK
jgi:tRNA modification GTPase